MIHWTCGLSCVEHADISLVFFVANGVKAIDENVVTSLVLEAPDLNMLISPWFFCRFLTSARALGWRPPWTPCGGSVETFLTT